MIKKMILVSLMSLVIVFGAKMSFADESSIANKTPTILSLAQPDSEKFETVKEEEKVWKLSLSQSFYSKYMGTDGEVYDKRAVSQTYLSLAHLPTGIYFSAWSNNPLTSNGCSDELDLTIGWSGDIGPLSLNLGVAYYDLKYFGRRKDSPNYLAPFIEVSKEIGIFGNKVTPYIRFEADYIVGNSQDCTGGFQSSIGCRFSREVTEWLSLRADAGITLDDGVYDFQKNEVLFAKVGLDFSWKSVTFGPELQVFHLCSHPGERADQQTNVAVGITVGYEF
ncbi:MAG: hypothetical protein WCO30_01645 [bacterium]